MATLIRLTNVPADPAEPLVKHLVNLDFVYLIEAERAGSLLHFESGGGAGPGRGSWLLHVAETLDQIQALARPG